MKEADKKVLIAKIKSSIEQTTANIAELENQNQPISPENAIGRISRMDAINNKGVIEAALRTAQNKLQQLQTALAKSSDPDFGKCTRCGNPIPEGRLMLLPGASRCVQCA